MLESPKTARQPPASIRVPTAYRLGQWTFVPSSHELLGASAKVKLEHRAARALELLCERRGEIVSQAEITTHLWGTRQVSANSVPVIIRDLRRALGDAARNPVYLETVAKGGYRLIAPEPQTATPPAPPLRIVPSWTRAAAAAAFVLVAAGATFALWPGQAAIDPPSTLILIGDLPNQTGNPAYDPLAQASEELLLANLGSRAQFKLKRVTSTNAPLPNHGRVLRFAAKLVLWSGKPDLVFVAEDARTADIVWSGFAFGEESTLPRKVDLKLAEFAAAAAPRP